MMIFSIFLSMARADENTVADNTNSSDDNTPVYDNPIRPLRPTTHPGDPNLTVGSLENFRRLYLDNDAILKMFGAKTQIKTSLPIINKTTGHIYNIKSNIISLYQFNICVVIFIV